VFRVPLTPRFAAAFGVTEALLGAMRDSCAARGIPFVVFAFPQKVEVDPKERDLELHHYGYDPQWFDLAAPYRRLRATTDSLGVPCIYPLRNSSLRPHPGRSSSLATGIRTLPGTPVRRRCWRRRCALSFKKRPPGRTPAGVELGRFGISAGTGA
jgi:hypothetical protein